VRFSVQFPAQGGLQFNFQPSHPDICCQSVVIGVRKIIETLSPLNADRARNRTVIHKQNRARVDGP
jgi:hypothetical protein